MALPTSGQITWDMIRHEFGGPYPINISEYYRGGPRVPNIPANANVPTAGAISANSFRGATASTPLTASLSRTEVFGQFSGAEWTAVVVTNTPVTAQASGGTGNYSYQWERVSGFNGIHADSPNSASTNFSANIQGTEVAVFRCRISDGISTVYTGNLRVGLTYIYNPVG